MRRYASQIRYLHSSHFETWLQWAAKKRGKDLIVVGALGLLVASCCGLGPITTSLSLYFLSEKMDMKGITLLPRRPSVRIKWGHGYKHSCLNTLMKRDAAVATCCVWCGYSISTKTQKEDRGSGGDKICHLFLSEGLCSSKCPLLFLHHQHLSQTTEHRHLYPSIL